MILHSRRKTPHQRRSALAGIRNLFSSSASKSDRQRKINAAAAYRPTYDKVADGPACRIYGSVKVKKVTANLHITTLGHGYMSFEHTDHSRE